MGTLSVEMAPVGSSTWSVLWSQSGGQHNSLDDPWSQAVIQVAPTVDSVVQVVGTKGTDYTSDIALDEFTVTAVTATPAGG